MKIIELTPEEAQNFFLQSDSYCNFELPLYFDFSNLLKKVSIKLANSKLENFIDKPKTPQNFEGNNYIILSNKDGEYLWRQLQLVHPAIYIALAQLITEKENWDFITRKFKFFSKVTKGCIECKSIPVKSSNTNRKDKAEQISEWWRNIEQESIRLSLEYKYLFHTDISNCYSSIYTHTISWALHGKKKAKRKKADKNLLGNKIDYLLQCMNYGQTNGLSEGNIISDFIAEIILGYIDVKLIQKLALTKEIKYKKNKNPFFILRYRDDYRIFVDDVYLGEFVLKILSEVLSEFNFKLNKDKTIKKDNIILYSLKEDKIKFLSMENYKYKTLQKELLSIFNFSLNFPNSGSLTKWINKFYERLQENRQDIQKEKENEIETLIAILVEIMYRNPRTIPACVACISILISERNNDYIAKIISKIIEKFKDKPNTSFLEIWLQRLTLKIEPNRKYKEKLCKKVLDKSIKIWETEWIKGSASTKNSLKYIINETDIINRNLIKSMDPIIPDDEFSVFSIQSL